MEGKVKDLSFCAQFVKKNARALGMFQEIQKT